MAICLHFRLAVCFAQSQHPDYFFIIAALTTLAGIQNQTPATSLQCLYGCAGQSVWIKGSLNSDFNGCLMANEHCQPVCLHAHSMHWVTVAYIHFTYPITLKRQYSHLCTWLIKNLYSIISAVNVRVTATQRSGAQGLLFSPSSCTLV